MFEILEFYGNIFPITISNQSISAQNVFGLPAAPLSECFGYGVFGLSFTLVVKTVSLFPGILFICNITLQMEMKISSCLQGLQPLVKIISVELVAFVL